MPIRKVLGKRKSTWSQGGSIACNGSVYEYHRATSPRERLVHKKAQLSQGCPTVRADLAQYLRGQYRRSIQERSVFFFAVMKAAKAEPRS